MSGPEPTALIVGVGGLGCPAALSLARAGVRRLTLVDGDAVELSNLHRQVLYTDADVGQRKVAVARRRLQELAPGIEVEIVDQPLDAALARELFGHHGVVVEGTDDAETKFTCSDLAIALDVPLIHAGVVRLSGLVFDIRRGSGCLRCLFEGPPGIDEVVTCSQAGILGPAAGVIGSLAAQRALAVLGALGPSPRGVLQTVDLRSGKCRRTEVRRRADCPTCSRYALDITAERCPMTYVRTKLRLEQLAPGDLLDVELQGDEPLRNVPRSLKEDGHTIVRSEVRAGRTCLRVKKGLGPALPLRPTA